jgi:hypothetical protein
MFKCSPLSQRPRNTRGQTETGVPPTRFAIVLRWGKQNSSHGLRRHRNGPRLGTGPRHPSGPPGKPSGGCSSCAISYAGPTRLSRLSKQSSVALLRQSSSHTFLRWPLPVFCAAWQPDGKFHANSVQQMLLQHWCARCAASPLIPVLNVVHRKQKSRRDRIPRRYSPTSAYSSTTPPRKRVVLHLVIRQIPRAYSIAMNGRGKGRVGAMP